MMRSFELVRPGDRLSVLCLGAHSDDIEIGAGGTILRWIAAGVQLDVHWCVLSAGGIRAEEATKSAAAFLTGAQSVRIELGSFRDGFFPYQGSEIKAWMEEVRTKVDPDIVLTHRRQDSHQDHREVCRLTWNTFRNHLILEYEIPKWDGDLGRPNFYVPLDTDAIDRKIELLLAHFGTQRSKDWFDAETFRGLARLRGMECRSPHRYAEAFILAKGQLA
jgi:LmbE family N-acetylglucosaminyl deacetylase